MWHYHLHPCQSDPVLLVWFQDLDQFPQDEAFLDLHRPLPPLFAELDPCVNKTDSIKSSFTCWVGIQSDRTYRTIKGNRNWFDIAGVHYIRIFTKTGFFP